MQGASPTTGFPLFFLFWMEEYFRDIWEIFGRIVLENLRDGRWMDPQGQEFRLENIFENWD